MRRPRSESLTVGDLQDAVDIATLQVLLGAKKGEPVSRAWAQNIAGRRGFPLPVLDHPRLRLWLRGDVEAWMDANRPGWRG
ncbi:hypothetical protein I6A60_31245 [Frankia sp. AgB1.9]|uniref:hypothetical protein n=1 Tax=unclassified Frankia TaxID=2632575 RepID=UPI001933D9A8|nr:MULTISPECIES: hypothetical protein [unclassified Frankia]MBL7493895.1 hypothetical protein [Frankia sp. AgW1.1]MBL7552306.1 hypothetical protein [Frankia sp. AgB1.9]MBL7622059.1 hypothetical protein [Frankia sp. AgB1.8]